MDATSSNMIDAIRRQGCVRGSLVSGDSVEIRITRQDGSVDCQTVKNDFPDWTAEERIALLRKQFGDAAVDEALSSL